MNNILKVSNINFSYKKKSILNNISFECSNGITALLGHNGAGKTTLMNIITGLKTPNNGSINLNNKNLLDTTSVPLKDIGYLPQNFDIFPNVTGYNFLSYICDLKNLSSEEKKTSLNNVIDRFDLSSVINLPFSKYSGGYKRRLGIAQAMLGNPSLLIIDEPTVGLDPEQRLEFRHYLSDIGNERVTLISTHIIEDAELYSNNVLVMSSGNILFQGTVNDIISTATPHIDTLICNIKELCELRKIVNVIEEKRIDNNTARIKFIKDSKFTHPMITSYDKEVSLENAYVYIQKQSNFS